MIGIRINTGIKRKKLTKNCESSADSSSSDVLDNDSTLKYIKLSEEAKKKSGGVSKSKVPQNLSPKKGISISRNYLSLYIFSI